MATSLIMGVNLPSILSPISTETCQNREKMVTGFGLSKTSQSKRFKSLIAASSFNHIPKQFREENLKEGLMENYKNVPQQFFGLSPSQLDMFATKDNPIFRQSAKIKEESLSSARSYSDSGRWTRPSARSYSDSGRWTMSSDYFSDHRGELRRKPTSPPPDLPSALLDARIVYLGLPLYEAVTELIVAELFYLHYQDDTKPIYLYINCLGVKNEKGEIIGECVDAYGIADALTFFKTGGVYTVNIGTAYGQAAMLLSLGAKGCRFLQPSSLVKLYLPTRERMDGPTTGMYTNTKDLERDTRIFLELLSQGTGKSEEVLRQDLWRSKMFNAQSTIEYGIADKVIPPERDLFEGKDALWPSVKKPRSRGGSIEATPL